jgi:hydroxymethylglutaryl-CoA reductase
MSRRRGLHERLSAKLTPDELALLEGGGLTLELADQLRENVLSTIRMPLSVADSFIVNGRELLVPMATEERSVILQAERGAALAAQGGGFKAESLGQVMIGQIQVVDVPDLDAAEARIRAEKPGLLEDANTVSSTRKAVDLQSRRIMTAVGPMLIVEIFVDVKDSMGANLVDSMCELIAPTVEQLSGGRVNMRILSNLATRRLVKVAARIPVDAIGREAAERVVKASAFADADPYRAATHNKGVMNGVVAVLLASGNDTRAVEAGAHAYASITGTYRPLSRWRISDGFLEGALEMPMSVGTVGGVVNAHPTARLSLRILGAESAADLAQAAASAGLACNLGALITLVTDGIKSIQP